MRLPPVALAGWLLFSGSSLLALDSAGPGLDLLLLFDRSGSMAWTGLDRIERPLLALALDDIAWNGRSVRVHHRFGVASFGSKAHVGIPLTLVDSGGLPALRRAVARAPVSATLGHTDFPAAFNTAIDAFASLTDDDRRRRAILLITDGKSDVAGMGALAARNALHDFVVRTGAMEQLSLHVLLVGSDGENRRFWAALPRTRVRELNGSRAEMLLTAHRAVTDLVATPVIEAVRSATSDSLVLPPYLDFVVFDILHGPWAKEVSVFPPGASQPIDHHTEGVEETRLGDALFTIVVRRPKPGVWTFRTRERGGGVRILAQQFFPRGELVEPGEQATVTEHDRVSVCYRLLDADAHPLQELSGYPLALHLALIRPDDSRLALSMQRETPAATRYRTTTSAECEAAGRYRTEVEVSTSDASGKRVTVFEDRWSGFNVRRRHSMPSERVRVSPQAVMAESSIIPLWPLLLLAVLVGTVMWAMGRR